MFLKPQNVLSAMNLMWTVSFTLVDTCACVSNVLSNSGPMQESALFAEQALEMSSELTELNTFKALSDGTY